MRTLARLSLLLSLLAASVACTLNYHEPETLDYGACPQNYQEVIHNYFQNSLLPPVRYNGEPVIWPPLRFKTRAAPTFPPGQLVWGYLVAAAEEATLSSNEANRGLHLYGFVFRGEELESRIDPFVMDTLAVDSGIAPVPLDERSWEEVTTESNENGSLSEYVPSGESPKAWSELISVRADRNLYLTASLEWAVAQTRNDAKPCAASALKILSSSPTELVFEQELARCPGSDDQYQLDKFIRAPTTLFQVRYVKKSPFTDEDRTKWSRLLGEVHLVSDCAPGAHR